MAKTKTKSENNGNSIATPILTPGDGELWVPIESVFPYENNPRQISDAAIDLVAQSIKDYGFEQPIVVAKVDGRDEIVVGHTRHQAAKKLGLTQVWIKRADHLTPEQIREYRIIDNKSNEKTMWAFDKLKMEFTHLDLSQPIFNLAFTPLELSTIANTDFDKTLPDNDGIISGEKRHTYTLTDIEFLQTQEAINFLREENPDLRDGEALARICHEWLNQVQ